MAKRNAVGTTTINAINKLIETLDAESFQYYDKLKACVRVVEEAYKVYSKSLSKKRLDSLTKDHIFKMSAEERSSFLKDHITQMTAEERSKFLAEFCEI